MSREDFDGTSISGAHVGDHINKSLSVATEAGTEPVQMALSLGVEAANIRRLTVQLQDRTGEAITGVVRLSLRLHSATMIESLAAAATLTEVAGGGTFVSTDAQAAAVLDTEADGTALVDIEDVTGVLVGDLNLLISPLDREGQEQFLAVTFA